MTNFKHLGGGFINDNLKKTSTNDKLIILIKQSSKIKNNEDLIELKRIRNMTKRSYINHKEFIDCCYDKYIKNN